MVIRRSIDGHLNGRSGLRHGIPSTIFSCFTETSPTRTPPRLPTYLLSDPSERNIPWHHRLTRSSCARTPVENALPIEVISRPDLVVLERKASGGGGKPISAQATSEQSFLSGPPIAEWKLYGYHKVRGNPGTRARVLATLGDEREPDGPIGALSDGRPVAQRTSASSCRPILIAIAASTRLYSRAET